MGPGAPARVQDGHQARVVADDQQQVVAHQQAAGFAALVDAHQVGDAGAADQRERECAYRPPGVNGTGKSARLLECGREYLDLTTGVDGPYCNA